MAGASPGMPEAMHQLGYELPERTGFGGLWESVAEAAETVHVTAGDLESEPTLIAECDGPTSAGTRAAIAAFRRLCCDQERAAA